MRSKTLPCTAQRPHRLSNLFGHIRIHSLLRTAAVVAVVALTGMFAWRTALMPAPITYFNADTTIMHVAMPDGSDIWLTPGSTLCYDETFHTDERRVHLDGEAYFDVEHDAKHPFDVVTPNLRVRVLGTVFSVRSLRGDHMAETTLAEGAVSLQRADGSNLIRLHPGQRAIYDTQDEQLEIKEVPRRRSSGPELRYHHTRRRSAPANRRPHRGALRCETASDRRRCTRCQLQFQFSERHPDRRRDRIVTIHLRHTFRNPAVSRFRLNPRAGIGCDPCRLPPRKGTGTDDCPNSYKLSY